MAHEEQNVHISVHACVYSSVEAIEGERCISIIAIFAQTVYPNSQGRGGCEVQSQKKLVMADGTSKCACSPTTTCQ